MKTKARVCVIHVRGPRNMTMSQVYTEFFRKNGISYDLITMEVLKTNTVSDAENHFNYQGSAKGFISKLISYIGYYNYAKRIIKNNEYAFVVVWSEITAVMMSRIFTKYCKGKYCVNVRDLLVGNRRILYPILNKTIRYSSFTTMSSGKYLDYLTRKFNDYYFVHSINQKIMGEVASANMISKRVKHKTIQIVFIGQVRFYDHFFKLINEIKNDDRYRFIIAGFGDEPVKDFIKSHNIKNVELHGMFDTSQTAYFLSQADVLYNLYGIEDINLRTALSNKLYYAMCLNIPILVYKNTYMYEMARRGGIGFAVDDSYEKHDFADEFCSWYNNRNISECKSLCDELINEAIESQDILLKRFEIELYNRGILQRNGSIFKD